MSDKRKKLVLPVLAAALLVSGSCNNISTPEAIQAHTPPTGLSVENVLTEPPEEQTAEDDVTPAGPEDDTGSEEDPAEESDTALPEEKSPEHGYMTAPETDITIMTAAETTTATEAETAALPETTSAPETSAVSSAPAETTAAPVPVSAAAPAAPAETAATAAQTAVVSRSVNYNAIGENGILVSYQNGHYRGIMACFGTYEMCDRWTAALNKFAEKLPDTKVYSLAAPIASEFYTPQKYWDSGFTVSQYNKCERIREGLSGVTHVDAYSALAAHTDEDIYSRTDHHWNPLGAYYAAEAFAETAGVEFPVLDSYTPVSRGGYVGSMYTYSKDYHLYNDPETFTMYLSPNADALTTTYYNSYYRNGWSGDLFVSRSAGSYYCSFIGSDDRISHIKTDVGNGRTLVVFKMSYGNALIPFLTSGFEDIYVCDMRYFDLNGVQFCKDVGATDLLFTDCVMMIAGNAGKYLEYILAV